MKTLLLLLLTLPYLLFSQEFVTPAAGVIVDPKFGRLAYMERAEQAKVALMHLAIEKTKGDPTVAGDALLFVLDNWGRFLDAHASTNHYHTLRVAAAVASSGKEKSLLTIASDYIAFFWQVRVEATPIDRQKAIELKDRATSALWNLEREERDHLGKNMEVIRRAFEGRMPDQDFEVAERYKKFSDSLRQKGFSADAEFLQAAASAYAGCLFLEPRVTVK